MAAVVTPNQAELSDPFIKAREILKGMPKHRIDPRRIKTTETAPRAKGGQSTVVLGTIVPPEGFFTENPFSTHQELFAKKFLGIECLAKLFEIECAVKKLKWDLDDTENSAKFVKSFLNELSLVAELSHPNIISLIGFAEEMQEGDAWIILPWEANGNVREFLQSGEWDIPERISLIQDVINGVEYLHTRQPPICHGDLKSLNILVSSSYHAVITDFGSARKKQKSDAPKDQRLLVESPRRTTEHNIAQELTSPHIKLDPKTLELTLTGPGFTLRWAAPEVLNDGVQDLPSDVWSFGWICWEVDAAWSKRYSSPVLTRVSIH